VQPSEDALDRNSTMTLEAFADTIVPGDKRWPGDRSVAGVVTDAGAVQAGAIEVLRMPASGLTDAILTQLATMLNGHAETVAVDSGLTLDSSVPQFVALPYARRIALVAMLTAPGHPERDGWVLLAQLSTMAYDTAAHMHTVDAIATGHPGLTAMGFSKPDADGLWRFPAYSYRRRLADVHPATTASGSPA
jgi:enediyne biosynthesis protein E8